jgi:hypothetical protein
MEPELKFGEAAFRQLWMADRRTIPSPGQDREIFEIAYHCLLFLI